MFKLESKEIRRFATNSWSYFNLLIARASMNKKVNEGLVARVRNRDNHFMNITLFMKSGSIYTTILQTTWVERQFKSLITRRLSNLMKRQQTLELPIFEYGGRNKEIKFADVQNIIVKDKISASYIDDIIGCDCEGI